MPQNRELRNLLNDISCCAHTILIIGNRVLSDVNSGKQIDVGIPLNCFLELPALIARYNAKLEENTDD